MNLHFPECVKHSLKNWVRRTFDIAPRTLTILSRTAPFLKAPSLNITGAVRGAPHPALRTHFFHRRTAPHPAGCEVRKSAGVRRTHFEPSKCDAPSSSMSGQDTAHKKKEIKTIF